MKAFKNIISRIKWKSVFGLISVVVLILLILWAFPALFAPRYKGSGDVQIKSWVEPSKVDLKGKSTVWIEIRNTGDENVEVDVNLRTYDKNLIFEETGNQGINESRILGPRESRKLDFKVNVDAPDSGKYGIKILVSHKRETIEDEVFLNVVER
ncbi:MAG TPA: hypothetical protein ENF58_04265 [Candidatus Altiarchaeales archaeon]|nr:hypothetical protein [Candidatus Altiarchaeales archaeon]